MKERKLRFPLLQGYDELDEMLHTMIDSEDLKMMDLKLPHSFKGVPRSKSRTLTKGKKKGLT